MVRGNNNLGNYNNHRNVNANNEPGNSFGMTLACFGALFFYPSLQIHTHAR